MWALGRRAAVGRLLLPRCSGRAFAAAGLKARLSLEQVQDGVMGLVTRYTTVPIAALQLETEFRSLESVFDHDAAAVLGASAETAGAVGAASGGAPPAGGEAPSCLTGAKKHRRVWDELDTVEFLLDVERFFGVTIADDVADAVATPQDAVGAVVDQLHAAGRFEGPAEGGGGEAAAAAAEAPAVEGGAAAAG